MGWPKFDFGDHGKLSHRGFVQRSLPACHRQHEHKAASSHPTPHDDSKRTMTATPQHKTSCTASLCTGQASPGQQPFLHRSAHRPPPPVHASTSLHLTGSLRCKHAREANEAGAHVSSMFGGGRFQNTTAFHRRSKLTNV